MSEALFDRAGLRVFERGWLSSNNVLFTGERECVLVDSGYASHAAQTLALVRAALPPGRRLDRIINTHLHSDHCGGNAALRQAFDCAVDVPRGECGKVDRWDEDALTYRATGQTCPRFERTGALVAGDVLCLGPLEWQVLAAPGHDPESVILYQPDLGLLISADALWESGFGVVFPELDGEAAFDDVRATLDLIAGLGVRCVIPGHGRPFEGVGLALETAYRRLDAYVADPLRHARHAVKVLIKFHMLECRSSRQSEFSLRAAKTPYFSIIHGRYFRGEPFDEWLSQVVGELVASGALGMRADEIYEPG